MQINKINCGQALKENVATGTNIIVVHTNIIVVHHIYETHHNHAKTQYKHSWDWSSHWQDIRSCYLSPLPCTHNKAYTINQSINCVEKGI